jgi:hypothetical protein
MKKLIPIVLLLASVCQAKAPDGPQGDVKAGIARAQSTQNILPTDPGMYVEEAGTILPIANRYLYTVDELSAAIKQLQPASRVAVRYQRRAIIVDT